MLQEKPKDGKLAVGSDNLLFRWEFLEALVRIAIAKFGKGTATQVPAEAIDMLVSQHLDAHVPAAARVDLNRFRTTLLYCEPVDDLFKKHEAVLRALYSRWRLRPPSGGLRTKVRPGSGHAHLRPDPALLDGGRRRPCVWYHGRGIQPVAPGLTRAAAAMQTCNAAVSEVAWRCRLYGVVVAS